MVSLTSGYAKQPTPSGTKVVYRSCGRLSAGVLHETGPSEVGPVSTHGFGTGSQDRKNASDWFKHAVFNQSDWAKTGSLTRGPVGQAMPCTCPTVLTSLFVAVHAER